MKKLLQLFLFLLTLTLLSQEKRILITGQIIDSIGIVRNANVINLKTNQGTFSLDNGSFGIFVSLGDSLQISSIQHITRKITISKKDIANESLKIKLKPNTYVLDEFELKKNHLMGRLAVDVNAVPTNKKDSILRTVMDFSKIDMKIVEADDYIDKRVRPQVVNTVANSFEGVGAAAKIPFKDSERLWALRKELKQKEEFPYKIISELGEKFFFEKLKIPVENYFHFLEYCNPLGIEKLYKEGKNLELIKILNHESNRYLKIIKKE